MSDGTSEDAGPLSAPLVKYKVRCWWSEEAIKEGRNTAPFEIGGVLISMRGVHANVQVRLPPASDPYGLEDAETDDLDSGAENLAPRC